MATALEGGEGSASRPGRSLPPGKTRYPLYSRLGGPQGPSGHVRKISPPPGFDPRTVQLVAIPTELPGPLSRNSWQQKMLLLLRNLSLSQPFCWSSEYSWMWSCSFGQAVAHFHGLQDPVDESTTTLWSAGNFLSNDKPPWSTTFDYVYSSPDVVNVVIFITTFICHQN